MPAPLTQTQLDTLQTFVTAGDRISYWSSLANWGFDYGRLALGVVLGDTINGRTANDFAEIWAFDEGVNLTPGDWAQIGQRVMERDLAARQDLHDNAPGVADISVATIRNYHADVFDEFGLPPETWTAFAPTMVAGPDGEDELWARILENAASGPDSLWVDAVIFAMMYDAAEDPENPHVVLAAQ